MNGQVPAKANAADMGSTMVMTAPREVKTEFPPDYNDETELNKGISCCFCCSIPKGAYWLSCWAGVSIVGAVIQLLLWFILLGDYETYAGLFLGVMVINVYVPTIYSMFVFYNAFICMVVAALDEFDEGDTLVDICDMTMGGLVWLFILYSVLELVLRIVVCKSLNPLACKKERTI